MPCHRGSNLEDICPRVWELGKRLIRRSKNDASKVLVHVLQASDGGDDRSGRLFR